MEYDLEFLLAELEDRIDQIDRLTFAIVEMSTNSTAADCLIKGVVEVAIAQGEILYQLKEEYDIGSIFAAQQAYQAMKQFRQQLERKVVYGHSKSRRRGHSKSRRRHD